MNITVLKSPGYARRYDKERGCYVYDISYRSGAELTERTLEVAEAFGLGISEEHEHVLYDDFELRLVEGDIVYITGDSGSGKSVLLKAIWDDLGQDATILNELEVPSNAPIIETVGSSFTEALKVLSLVGLNDAFLFLRQYSDLSEGQKYRYRIAQLIEQDKKYWLCDEFCSTLDRTTSKIVSHNIQKHARRSGKTLIVATTHEDLFTDLNPNIFIRKGWGQEIKVSYHTPEPRSCSVAGNVTVRESNREEYGKLSHLHYRNAKAPVPYRFYALELVGELIGVIVYSYPPVHARGRKDAVGYTPNLTELNQDWTQISRVVIHPKYRSIGLGIKLVKESLRLQGRKHVELTAVMAQYNPFAEKAGMKPILLTTPHKTVLQALEELKELGFNPSLMGSKSYNERIIKDLPDLEPLHNILKKVSSQYYKRLTRKSMPYVKKDVFIRWLKEQETESLAKSLKTLTTLSTTKAYLYYHNDSEEDSK